MGKECTMPEVLKVIDEREDEFELNLELSIGGSYGKKPGDLNKMEGKTRDPFEEKEKVLMINDVVLLKTDFSCGGRGDVGGGENGCEFMDLQRKRESQVLKRQEARKKREGKIIKSLGSKGLNRGVFAEDKLFLENQQLQARVQDREMRENDGFLNRKRGKNGTDEVGKDLNLSLFKEDKISAGAIISSQQMQMQCLFPQVQYVPLSKGIAYCVVPSMGTNVGKVEKDKGNLFGSLACKNAAACHGNGNSSIECDLEQSNVENASGNRETVSNGSLEQSSSAVSDYHSTTQKGESGSDTGSHSSPLCSILHHTTVPRRGNTSEHIESNNTSSRAQLKHQRVMSIPQYSSTSKSFDKSKPDNHSNQTTNTYSTPYNRTSPTLKETRVAPIEKPPKPPNNHRGAIASVSHMPRVSTTGNGPNAKTIMGFLYKYTKMEVSIMCACHGSSFTPAEFVEHAGGVDISHPMRHITIVPSAFG